MMRWCAPWVLGLCLACSGSESEGEEPLTPLNPADSQQEEESETLDACDGQGSCPACQGCVYAEGGSCEVTVANCVENEQCVALNGCMTECVGSDPTVFEDCRVKCGGEHEQGEADYAAVLSCVESACVSDCKF